MKSEIEAIKQIAGSVKNLLDVKELQEFKKQKPMTPKELVDQLMPVNWLLHNAADLLDGVDSKRYWKLGRYVHEVVANQLHSKNWDEFHQASEVTPELIDSLNQKLTETGLAIKEALGEIAKYMETDRTMRLEPYDQLAVAAILNMIQGALKLFYAVANTPRKVPYGDHVVYYTAE